MKILFIALGTLFFAQADAMLVPHSSASFGSNVNINMFARSWNLRGIFFGQQDKTKQDENAVQKTPASLNERSLGDLMQIVGQMQKQQEQNIKMLENSIKTVEQLQKQQEENAKILKNSIKTVGQLQKQQEQNIKMLENSTKTVDQSQNKQDVNTKIRDLTNTIKQLQTELSDCKWKNREKEREIDNLKYQCLGNGLPI